MASLTVRNLSKRFGAVEVLKGINLEVETGEFIVLVGPSGCGKSTLLAMIAGLETITSGDIVIGGRLVNHIPPKDRDIAMVFQSYALYPTMTVRQNITFGMESRRVPKAEQKQAVERVTQLLHIEELLDRKPSQLSGGQRQRVAMGRALVRDPALFLFDEPLSNLDAKLRVEMRTEIKKLYQRIEKTTVYVTHDQVEAMTLASRIAVMHHGRLQQFAEPRSVYERPANMFVAGFMGSPAMARPNGGGTTVLKLPAERAASAGSPGRRVILGLRPEHLTHHDPTRTRREVGLIEAPVEVVEPTGSETIVIVRLGEREVTARFEPDQAPAVGDKVTLAVDMAKVCLFDPQSERLI
jgi:multiple sugar transport system ATP-binding protein